MNREIEEFLSKEFSKLETVRDLHIQYVSKIKCPSEASAEKLMRHLHELPEIRTLRLDMIKETRGRYFPLREFFDIEGDILLIPRSDLVFARFRFRFNFLEMISPTFVAEEASKYILVYHELSSDFWRMSHLQDFLDQMREWKLRPRPEKRWWKVDGRWKLCNIIGDAHNAW